MSKVIPLLALLAFTGCAQQPQRTVYDAAFDECRAYGFTPNTEPFGACMQREVQGRRDMALRLMYGR